MCLAQKSRTSGRLENLTNTFTGASGAFQVLVSTNLSSDFLTLLRGGLWLAFRERERKRVLIAKAKHYLFTGDGLLIGLVQFGPDGLIITQVNLASYEDDGETRAEVQNLRNPLKY